MVAVPTAFNSGLGQKLSQNSQTPFQSLSTSAGTFGTGQNLQTAASGALKLGAVIAAREQQIRDDNDKAAVGRAIAAARKNAEEQLLDNVYSQSSGALFSKGQSPSDVYKGTSKYFTKSEAVGKKLLSNDRQRALFAENWSKYQTSENERVSSHLGSQFRSYVKEASDAQKVEAQEYLGNLSSAIETDWRQADKLLNQGHTQIMAREQLGLDQKDATILHGEWDDEVAASAVRGWFSEQADRLGAAESLLTGNIQDKDAKRYWESLDAKQRKTVRNDLISQAQKLAQFSNDQRSAAKDAAEAQAAEVVNEFFITTGEENRGRRAELYDSVKNNPHVSQATKRAMRDNLFGGQVTQDVEEGVRELEALIYSGAIKSIEEANAFRYKEQRVATDETLRNQIYPLIEQMQNKDFSGALQAGRAALGIVEGAAVTNQVVSQRAGYFESAFRRHMAKNPDDDPWEVSKKIEDDARERFKADAATMGMLKTLKKRYDDAVVASDPVAAAAVRSSADSLLGVLGLTWEDIK